MSNILDFLIGNILHRSGRNQNAVASEATGEPAMISRKSAKNHADRIAAECSRNDVDDDLAREDELANLVEAKRKAARRDHKIDRQVGCTATQEENDRELGSSIVAQNADIARIRGSVLAHIGGAR